MDKAECVCEGNWRLIIRKMQPLFNRMYADRKGKEHKLCGVLWAEDDFYYAMWDIEKQQITLYTCVGSLEQQGLNLVPTGNGGE
jgi:hypothetical protein